MNALAIHKGASRHSAYDLRDPFNGPEETHTLAILVLDIVSASCPPPWVSQSGTPWLAPA